MGEVDREVEQWRQWYPIPGRRAVFAPLLVLPVRDPRVDLEADLSPDTHQFKPQQAFASPISLIVYSGIIFPKPAAVNPICPAGLYEFQVIGPKQTVLQIVVLSEFGVQAVPEDRAALGDPHFVHIALNKSTQGLVLRRIGCSHYLRGLGLIAE